MRTFARSPCALAPVLRVFGGRRRDSNRRSGVYCWMDTSVSTSDSPAASRLEKAVLLLAVVLPLVGAVWGIALLWNRLVTWTDVVVLLTFYVLTGTGIGVGFHRMLTHRSFDAPAPVRFFFLALGSMALQGPAVEWAATHVKHHAKSDKDGDPHSPLHGFWHAHTG